MPRKSAEETTSSVYRGADGFWHARVTMERGHDGERVRKHVRRRTKSELRDAVREVERARDAGMFVWTRDDITLEDWLEHWLETVLPMTARWKTLSTYRSQMRVHVIPVLGRQRLSELRPENLEELYRAMRRQGSSTHVVRAVHRVLRSSLNEAVRRRRLAHNPALVARPPRADQVEVDPLSVEETRRVLAAAGSTRHPVRWSIALALGLRQGEALALMWSDVDLRNGNLRVRRSCQRHTWNHGCEPTADGPSCGHRRGGQCEQREGGGLLLVEPKTKASVRSIVMPPPLVEELRSQRSRVNQLRLSAGEDWEPDLDLVFPTPTGGLIDPARDNAEWGRLIEAAGVRRVRLHDARHTAATLLLLQSVDIRTVMSIMGWTEMATAQRYTHAVDELRRRAAMQMGDLLWSATDSG
ncbi:tyrosine-type recombinase/integrase [Phycicoccus flavus]|uniref:Site-specific integrase n=1 Tax=Phycicoccus flavus TaxID=2502783 RepID=A0A8T6R9U2_9MICO|nr:site-specific integrase [Phycicoccus flavus]NHA70160.1 site-specific integrase [Phycicoccus flavus]